MDPVTAIVWVSVVVFAGTSAIALMYLVGFVPQMKEQHGSALFKILITEIVVASVAAFGYYIHSTVRQDVRAHLPVGNLMLFEQHPPMPVYDGSRAMYLRAADVGRSRRMVDVHIDLSPDFSAPVKLQLAAGQPQTFSLGSSKYRISFTQTGTIDADPEEKRGKNTDFARISLSKEEK